MSRMSAATIFLALLYSGEARSDWQYSRWGMTVEELVGASNGAARRTSDSEAKKSTMGKGLGPGLAQASYKTSDFAFTAWFYFPKGKLAAVRLVGLNARQQYSIEGQLERVYGKALEKEESKLIPQCTLRTLRWKDDTAKNFISFSSVVCYPEDPKLDSVAILYEPTLTKPESGL